MEFVLLDQYNTYVIIICIICFTDKNKFQVNRDAVASKNENNGNDVDNCPTLNNDRREEGEKKHNDSYLSKDMSEIIE